MLVKLENDKITFCPRNGYVNGVAISNIDVYFENNPEVARAEGYFPLVLLEEPANNIRYELRDGVVYEIVNEGHIEETDKHTEQTHDTNETIA